MNTLLDLQLNFEAGKYGDIVREWEVQDQQIASDPEVAFVVAASFFRLGNYEKALSMCEQIEGPFQNHSNFLAMFAAILRRQGLFERAEVIFKRALEIEPGSESVRNNFSNLLIDQKRFEEAEKLLASLIKENPNYEDAKRNMNRLVELKANELKELKKLSSEELPIFNDPLDAAFKVDEVVKCGAEVGNETASLLEIIRKPNNSELEQADLEMLQLANKQVETKQYKGALELCSKVRSRRGVLPTLYKIASDAYIGLENFSKAEVMALMALDLGEQSVANYINLSSLAAMRKDQMMARHWLEKARLIDKNDQAVKQGEQLLFPDGHPRGEDNPMG